MIEMICKELGVEIGEIFKMKPTGEDEQSFRLDKFYGLDVYNKSAGTWVSAGNHIYSDFITGRIKPTWKPKTGSRVWMAVPFEESKVWEINWCGTSTDETALTRGLIFKAKEEAIECTNKMLRAVRG